MGCGKYCCKFLGCGQQSTAACCFGRPVTNIRLIASSGVAPFERAGRQLTNQRLEVQNLQTLIVQKSQVDCGDSLLKLDHEPNNNINDTYMCNPTVWYRKL